MDVFGLHKHVVAEYATYTQSFIRIGDPRIEAEVTNQIKAGLLWPYPLVQLNPCFERGPSVDELVQKGILHQECGRIFRAKQNDNDLGRTLMLHRHQAEAIQVAAAGHPFVVTTGTGSGKSLCYMIPIVDHVLRNGSGRGIQAIVVYPMNALANSQVEELDKFLQRGYPEGQRPVTYRRYTGQESKQERDDIINNPPDILLTNYVMLELILTRVEERALVHKAHGLRFLVLDELHTYRGRQGADVAMLVRRCRDTFSDGRMLCVGTSATMASEGDSLARAAEVARVASLIFGTAVEPKEVIAESLVRATEEIDFSAPATLEKLRECIIHWESIPADYETLRHNALAAWIESTFGVRREGTTGKLIRETPQAVRGEAGAASKLAQLVGISVDEAERAIEAYLLGGSSCKNAGSPYPLFAFRLHQFITRGDTVWATIESEQDRFITLRSQQFKPGDRSKVLFPMVFCRHCGQAYYSIERPETGHAGPVLPRSPFARPDTDFYESGYLYMSAEHPWPEQDEAALERVPDSWIETRPNGTRRVRPGQPVPEIMLLRPDGTTADDGLEAAFVPSPFRFCLNPKCRVAHNPRQRSDVGKLATIGVDGRSTATSILVLSTILRLRQDEDLTREARKLLSFTDNRQDASLQAGHFNDFTEVGLVRSALYRALQRAGEPGVRYDELAQHVERAMNLPLEFYANAPEIDRGPGLEETRRALRSVVGYFVYRDLERGWRITSPNLEECGLLKIEYVGADELAADGKFWQDKNAHQTLISASAEQRLEIIRALLDHLRRSLAIKEEDLDRQFQEQIYLRSNQRLCDPWVIDDVSSMEVACFAWPRSSVAQDRGDDVYISPTSNFGLFLKRPNILPATNLSQTDLTQIIADLFRCLKVWGLVEEVRSPQKGTAVFGYQLPSSVMLWKAGDGSKPLVDRLRITQETKAEREANRFFVNLYKTFADFGAGLEAREHTAQVPAETRRERERDFREGELPVLFCSPTMELGVDIAQLNVVNMRNVPPTPANYAQRSGRAGRSGQPAFVFTYCSGFSPHDRYYFQNPGAMVAGQVNAPKIDLLNRDLVQAHVHAVWLAEAQMNLGTTLAELLVVTESDLKLPLAQRVVDTLDCADIRHRALLRARRVLDAIGEDLLKSTWYREGWLEDVLNRIPRTFDAACDRWRSLFRAAVQQRHVQNKVIGDHTRNRDDIDRAKRLRAQAESQIQLLTTPQSAIEGDFYSYRYFASEGFLPGYNFPRLPVSAFIPARRGRKGRDEYLSRPRFLAISEFGPRAVIYHEGARYRINKVNLAFDNEEQAIAKNAMKICTACGYGHLVPQEPGPDICENCRQPLLPAARVDDMVRLQNVTAKRIDRITSEEEERQRIGYEIRSTFRFGEVDGRSDVISAEVFVGQNQIARLRYGDAATMWRINLGWLRRAVPTQNGFMLDTERGYWATNQTAQDNDASDPMSPRIERVVPYVEDRRNVLTIQFQSTPSDRVMASLQAAFKEAVQRIYQLEPSEVAADPLPSQDNRQLIFLYEAAEGGAGVLRQIVEDPAAFPAIARQALEICHFDPDTGEDLGAAAANGKGCEAGCYDCLLDYGNQGDHRLVDRKLILKPLQDLAAATVVIGVGLCSRTDQLRKLYDKCDSQLEKRWLKLVDDKHLRLPTEGQYLIESCVTRPDFYYGEAKAAIYIDGPPHDDPAQKELDGQIKERLSDAGHLVIRFHHQADWDAILAKYQDVFGG